MKKYFKGLSIDFIFFSINLILQFLLIPIYLKFISLEELGVWFSMQTVFGFVSLTGLLAGNNYFVKKISNDEIFYSDRANSYYSNVIFFQMIGMLIFALVGVGLSTNLDNIIRDGGEIKSLEKTFLFALFAVALNFPFSSMVSVYRARHYTVFANTVENMKVLLVNMFALFFLFNGFGFFSFGLSFLCSYILVNAYIYKCFKVEFNFRFLFSNFSLDIMKETYNYMRHFIPLIFLNLLRGSYMPILILKLLGPQYVAIFNLSYKVPLALQGLLSKIAINLYPFLTKSYEENVSVREKFLITLKISLRISIFFVILLYFINASFVGLWVGEDKFINENEFLFLLVAFFVYLMANSIGVFINASGNFGKLVFFSILDIFIAFFISYLFFYKYQLLALIIGYIFSRLSSFLYVLTILMRSNNVKVFSLFIGCLKYSVFSNLITFFALFFLEKTFLEPNSMINISYFFLIAVIVNIVFYEGFRFLKPGSKSKSLKSRIRYAINVG